MKFKRWAAGIAALLLILSMGLISCAKPAGGTPEIIRHRKRLKRKKRLYHINSGFLLFSMENPYCRTLEAFYQEAIENQAYPDIQRPEGRFYGADPADPGHDCRRNPGYFLVSGGLGENRSALTSSQRGRISESSTWTLRYRIGRKWTLMWDQIISMPA